MAPRFRFPLFALIAMLLAPLLVDAEIRLPEALGDHMVLQRNAPIHIWGWADAGETVKVTLRSDSRETAADQYGKWSVYLPPQSPGGPFLLTITGSTTLTLSDILIGDLWIASGQSNMEMPLAGFPNSAILKNGADEIGHATQPSIRLLVIGKKSSPYPLNDIDGAWTECTPETAKSFSAVAYFFGREITEREHVPIGLIDTTWGGTPAEAWTSLEGLSSDASLMPAFATRALMMEPQAEVPVVEAAEKRADAAAVAAHQTRPAHPWHPDPASWEPAGLFNGMIAPLTPLTIKGVIWYQGESNSRLAWAPLYSRLFPAMIADWRMHWQQGDFPFLYVQISSFRSTPEEDWGTIRDAQRRTLSVANTAMAVTIDVGDPENVHPADKQTVGARLALAARTLVYGERGEYSGPLFRQATPEAAPDTPGMRVWFDHIAQGLVAGNPAVASAGGKNRSEAQLKGFELAGPDGCFVPASARIDGDSVLVSSNEIQKPAYVRYAWPNAPVANLYNSAGLPASTFTSKQSPFTNPLLTGEVQLTTEGERKHCIF